MGEVKVRVKLTNAVDEALVRRGQLRSDQEIVGVTEPLIIDWEGRDTLEEALVLGDEVILGQTVLEKLDVLADCARQRLVPNPEHPDQPVSKIR